MTRLIGVYNANGGFLGELAYIRGKITDTHHCALCDITHGNNPFGRKEWKEARARLFIPLELVHLNEMDARTKALMKTTAAPAVVVLRDDGTDAILLTSEDLKYCDKDPQKLVSLINERLVHQ